MIATRFYLDTRRCQEGSTAPLKISIYWKRSVAYLSIGVNILPSAWDQKAQCTKERATQHRISEIKVKVDSTLARLQEQHLLDGLNAAEIKEALERELSPDASEKTRLIAHIEHFASTRKKERTREIYRTTISRIREFDRQADLLRFEDIDIDWLDRFDAFLAKTAPKRNARNVHLRNIRAAFNDAMKRRITMYYPFRGYSVRPEPTMKKNLSVDQLRALFAAQLPEWQQKYVDFFKISFLLIGINTEDLVHATGIVNGRLDYRRAKTYRPYSIKVEPECRELIERYPGNDYLLDILDRFSNTHNWTACVDRALKVVAAELDLPPISVNWARHSWATIASDLDIPVDTIAAAMGHSGNTVTYIYINFDRAKIDQANRKVIDYVLYGKSPMSMFDLMLQLNEKMEAGGEKDTVKVRK